MKLFNKKYRFFKNKIYDVQTAIWEMEFKVAKARQVREGVRLDRDRAVESINMINARLGNKELSKEDKEKYEKELASITDNKARYERQMQMIDDEINGAPATQEREMVVGILERLKGYAELQAMYKEYLKTC